jgi:hypothetical protein
LTAHVWCGDLEVQTNPNPPNGATHEPA